MEKLFSTKQAAEFLGVDRRTIQRYCKDEILTPTAFSKNGYPLFTTSQLVEGATRWLKKCDTTLKNHSETATRYKKLLKRLKKSPTNRENVQIFPATKRIVPNFKLCKTMSVLSEEKYTRMVEGSKSRNYIEKRNYKRKYTIRTIYKVSNAEGYDNTDPLDLFDYSVLSVCISNFAVGNYFITPAIIYRGLTGKVTKGSNARPSKDQLAEILNSITKLMSTIIDIDESEANSAFKYCKGRDTTTRSAILPCQYTKTTINGQNADTIIKLERESPFMVIARDRKQLLTYDAALLDVPNMQNTKMNIMLKNYAMIRVSEIKLHKMTPTLTFADVFKKCRIENASRKIKMNARNTLIDLFERFQAEGIIKKFELTKRANAFYSIKFIY